MTARPHESPSSGRMPSGGLGSAVCLILDEHRLVHILRIEPG
ncbi:hypothetical protein [Sphaerimonospora mesophila]